MNLSIFHIAIFGKNLQDEAGALDIMEKTSNEILLNGTITIKGITYSLMNEKTLSIICL